LRQNLKVFFLLNSNRDWINLYGGEEFSAIVFKALAIIDRLTATMSLSVRSRVNKAFALVSKREWLFWNSVWKK
jgi:thiaminase